MILHILTLAFGSGVLITLGKLIYKLFKTNEAKTEAMSYGVQALLRDRLYEQYERYHTDKGYAPAWVKINFENMYKRYHTLGENGVMDQHYEDFMKLPDKPLEVVYHER